MTIIQQRFLELIQLPEKENYYKHHRQIKVFRKHQVAQARHRSKKQLEIIWHNKTKISKEANGYKQAISEHRDSASLYKGGTSTPSIDRRIQETPFRSN